jgi:hypothetical protein
VPFERPCSNGSTSSPDPVDTKAGGKAGGKVSGKVSGKAGSKVGGNNGATVEPATDDLEPKNTKGTNGTNGRNGTRTPALVTSPALATSSFTPDGESSSNGTGRQ